MPTTDSINDGYNAWDRTFDWPLFRIMSLRANAFPVYSMETNTAFTEYMDDIVRDASLWAGMTKGLDRNPFSRLGIFVSSVYLHWATTFYSHEIAHMQDLHNRGHGGYWSLDFTDWSTVVPMLNKTGVLSDPASELRTTLNGLNQQEFNSDCYFRKSVMAGEFDLDDAFSYVFNNLSDVAYHVVLRDMSIGDIQSAKNRYDEYFERDLNINEWAALSVVSGLASVHTWESLSLMLNYLASGRRSKKTFAFSTPGLKIYPPHVSFHLTPYDYFVNAETPLKFDNGIALFLNMGSTLEAPDDPLRFGVRSAIPLHLRGGQRFTLQPEGFLNFDDDGYRGARAGIRADIEVAPTWELSIAGLWHKGDYVSEDIMGYGVTYGKPRRNPVEPTNAHVSSKWHYEPPKSVEINGEEENVVTETPEEMEARWDMERREFQKIVESYPKIPVFTLGITLNKEF